MLKIFYPYEYVESVFSIDYKKLYEKGYRGLIFDIDNTIQRPAEDSERNCDESLKGVLTKGFKPLVLSKNSEKRVQKFLENIDSLYIHDAKKPSVPNYLKSLEMLNLKKEEAVVIGDQVFTDVLGANRSGIASILVKYMDKGNEIKIGKRRQLEKIILGFYKRSKKYQNRIGNIVKEKE